MRYFAIIFICLQWWPGLAFGQNDHGISLSTGEQRARDHDAHLPYVSSGCVHLLPVASREIAAEGCDAYVTKGPAGKKELTFARQVAVALTIPDVTGTHWIAIDESTSATRAGYTRPIFSGRYLLQQSPTQPAAIDGVLVVTTVEIAENMLTVVTPFAYRSPRDAAQRRHSVTNWNAIAGDGLDDFDTITRADRAAAQSVASVYFPCGTYSIDSTAAFAADPTTNGIFQTASWIGEDQSCSILQRIDFASKAAIFSIKMIGQTGLTYANLTLDGQASWAVGTITLPNVEPGVLGSYPDVTNEDNWSGTFGYRIENSVDVTVRDSTFKNIVRAGFRVGGSASVALADISKNITIDNVTVRRTRSCSGGDGVYVGASQNVTISNTYIFDYQRIGLVFEFDNNIHSRDVLVTNTIAEFGHDVCPPESNAGFWVEGGEDISLVNTVAKDTALGYLMNCGAQSDTGTTRPQTCNQSVVSGRSLRTRQAFWGNYGGLRSVSLNVVDFFGEANKDTPAFATVNSGVRGGILFGFDDVTSNTNMRANFTDVFIHNINQSTGTTAGGYGAFRLTRGLVAAPSQFVISLDNFQSRWSKTDGTDDVTAKTDYETTQTGTSASYFGDVVLGGHFDTSPSNRFNGRLTIENGDSHTFGYLMIATETFTDASLIIINTPFSHRFAGIANGGKLFINDAPLVDFRGTIGHTKIAMANSNFIDANLASLNRAFLTADLVLLSNNQMMRQLPLDMEGGSSTNRFLRLIATGNDWHIAFDIEPALLLVIADSTFAQVQIGNNTFRNKGTGTADATDVILRIATATGTVQFMGSGNAFDSTFLGTGHVIETDNTPTFNDTPFTIGGPWLEIVGRFVIYEPL